MLIFKTFQMQQYSTGFTEIFIGASWQYTEDQFTMSPEEFYLTSDGMDLLNEKDLLEVYHDKS